MWAKWETQYTWYGTLKWVDKGIVKEKVPFSAEVSKRVTYNNRQKQWNRARSLLLCGIE